MRRVPATAVPVLLCVPLMVAACGGQDAAGAAEADTATHPTTGVFGVAPGASGGIPAVVTLTATDGPRNDAGDADADPTTSAVPSTTRVDQFGLQFSPTVALVRVGGTVSFTNSEGALSHNVQVRSVSGREVLLDEDAVTGDRIDLVLLDEGGYDVSCDMHPGMTAFIFVTPAPFGVFAETDGSFHLESVAPGRYEMAVWSTDPESRSSTIIDVGEGATEVAPSGPVGPS